MRLHITLIIIQLSLSYGESLKMLTPLSGVHDVGEPKLGVFLIDDEELFSLEIKNEKDSLSVFCSDGNIIYQRADAFVSKVLKSKGDHICLHIRRGDINGSSSVGILYCTVHNGRVMSTLIVSEEKKIKGEYNYFYSRILEFKYPDLRVSIGAHKDGEEGEYWEALYTFSHE